MFVSKNNKQPDVKLKITNENVKKSGNCNVTVSYRPYYSITPDKRQSYGSYKKLSQKMKMKKCINKRNQNKKNTVARRLKILLGNSIKA